MYHDRVKRVRVLSLLLFISYYILRTCDRHGIQLDNKRLGDVDFADGISLLESCKQKLQQYIKQVRDIVEPFGIKINTSSEKIMANNGLNSIYDAKIKQ